MSELWFKFSNDSFESNDLSFEFSNGRFGLEHAFPVEGTEACIEAAAS